MRKVRFSVALAMKMRATVVAVAFAATLLPFGASQAASQCADSSGSAVGSTSDLGLPSGAYTRPTSTPESLVVFAHGYRHRSTSWIGHMRAANAHGALAVTMDYTGIGPAPDNRGWNVSAGAADSIAAAQFFLAHCKSIRNVVIFGVSMGGNTSGLAVAAKATRPDGSPLFDYWFDVEGANNVIETYLAANAVAPVNAYAAGAAADITAEMGGSLAEQPQAYLERTVVLRGDDIKESGIKGVVLVHGLDDGLVPYNQSREMKAVLRQHEIPAEMITVVRKGSGESGTTITGNVLGSNGSPFAGHGSESSSTQRVIRIAHDRLHTLLDTLGTAEPAVPTTKEVVVDDAGTAEAPL